MRGDLSRQSAWKTEKVPVLHFRFESNQWYVAKPGMPQIWNPIKSSFWFYNSLSSLYGFPLDPDKGPHAGADYTALPNNLN